jgi:hypothetical protein
MADIERYIINGEPRYRIHSGYAKDSVAVTPQDLLDIMDWCLLHAKTLEQERDEAQGIRIPPGHSVSSGLDPKI